MLTTKINYDEYIQSEAWKALAHETKRLAGFHCQVCYGEGELHTHHRTYDRLGHEFQSDLIALCESCHALFHGKYDVISAAGWPLVKSLTAEISTLRTMAAASQAPQ